MNEKDVHVAEKSEPQYELKRVAQHLFKMIPGGRYYVIVRKRGVVFRQSLKTSDRQLADKKLKEILEKLERTKLGSKRLLFNDLFELWRDTWFAARDLKPSSRKDRLLHVGCIYRKWPALKDMPIRDITLTMCEQWFAGRKQEVSPYRINGEMITLRMIFTFAVREGFIMDNPARGLRPAKLPRTQIKAPTRNDVVKVVQRLRSRKDDETANFVELLGYSGMRKNEACSILWEDVDFDKGWFRVTGGEKGTKNRQIRYVPLFPNMRTLLERIKSSKGQVSPQERVINIRECRKGVASACQQIGVNRFNLHSLRHWFTSNAIENGVDFKVISNWIGHSDGGILVAKTYGHLRQTFSEAMAAKMIFSA